MSKKYSFFPRYKCFQIRENFAPANNHVNWPCLRCPSNGIFKMSSFYSFAISFQEMKGHKGTFSPEVFPTVPIVLIIFPFKTFTRYFPRVSKLKLGLLPRKVLKVLEEDCISEMAGQGRKLTQVFLSPLNSSIVWERGGVGFIMERHPRFVGKSPAFHLPIL